MIRKIIFLTLILLLIALFSCTNLTEPVNPVCWITYPEANGTWVYPVDNIVEISAKVEGMYRIKKDSIEIWITPPGKESFEESEFLGFMTKMEGSDNQYYYKLDVSDSTKFWKDNYYNIFIIAKDINGLGASDRRYFRLSQGTNMITATLLAKNKVKLSWDFTSPKYKRFAVFRSTKSDVNPSNGTFIGETTNQEITDNSALINQKAYYRLYFSISGQYTPVGSSISVTTLSKDWTEISGWPSSRRCTDVEILNENVICVGHDSKPPSYTQYSYGALTSYTLSHQEITMEDMLFSICPINDNSGWAGLWDRICYYTNHNQVVAIYRDQLNPYKVIDEIQSGSPGTFAIAYDSGKVGIRLLSFNNMTNQWSDVTKTDYKYNRLKKIVLNNGLVWLFGVSSSTGNGVVVCHNDGTKSYNLDYEVNGLSFNSSGTYGIAVSKDGIAAVYINGVWSKYSVPSYVYQKLFLTSSRVISPELYFLGTTNRNMYFYNGEHMNIMESENLPADGAIWNIFLTDDLSDGIFIHRKDDQTYTSGYRLQ
ncbi:MAG: hypothetical protein JXA60_02500 [Candidatus Coatesbacteria bacterium]|nr:hypothetical protein [Candidatus Coatesbacteria bacterium]